jgi:hypothetical protein
LNNYEPQGRNNMAYKLEDDDAYSLRSYPRQQAATPVTQRRETPLSRGRRTPVKREENIFITGNGYEKPSTPGERKVDDNYSKYDDTLSINQIYNKNLDRIRLLNNIEDNLFNYNTTELKKMGNIFEGEKYVDVDKHDNFDEFLKKLNNIKNY